MDMLKDNLMRQIDFRVEELARGQSNHIRDRIAEVNLKVRVDKS